MYTVELLLSYLSNYICLIAYIYLSHVAIRTYAMHLPRILIYMQYFCKYFIVMLDLNTLTIIHHVHQWMVILLIALSVTIHYMGMFIYIQ